MRKKSKTQQVSQTKQTIVEKIFSSHSEKLVTAGDYVIADLDLIMAHDTTCAWAIPVFEQIARKVFDPQKIFVPFDHAYPAPNVKMAELQKSIREFAKRQDLQITTSGVCHQLLAEKYIEPGMLVLGADSHTPTGGALGAVCVGVGSSDIAVSMATGKNWFKVPESVLIKITGQIPKGVYSKDIILYIAKELGPEAGLYKAFEFTGETVKNMSVSQRLTLTNMSAELGVKAAIVPPDEKTLEYLNQQQRPGLNLGELESRIESLRSDEGCSYIDILEFDVSELVPQVACPHEIHNVKDVIDLRNEKLPIDQVFIGSCTNGRIEDLEIAVDILKGHNLAENLRLIVTPASESVLKEARERGYIDFLTQIGASITCPGCGACLGRNGGVLASGEVCIATSNRNFKGRMGSPESQVYLASPATAAASAIKGYITD
jgi:3-isopropylmalate/(R)-2-methylmalate dehydratase large subunit